MHTLQALGWGPDFARAFAALRDPELTTARISAEHRGQFDIVHATGHGRALLRGSMWDVAPAVGDWVAVRHVGDDTWLVEHLLPRRSQLARKAAGRSSSAQVMVANVDVVLIVTALDRDFNPRRIERYLQVVHASGARPVVVLSKCDLVDDPTDRIAEIRGAEVVPTSAVTGLGLDAVAALVQPGETVVLIGSSGVGKSTLVNALLGGEQMRVQAISDVDGRGLHTTTHRQLLVLPGGGVLIDSPGMRELGLHDDESALDAVFDDIAALEGTCRFRDCSHAGEPGCAIDAAVTDGTLSAERLASYRKLQRELRHERTRADAAERKRESRRLGKLYRNAAKTRKRMRGE